MAKIDHHFQKEFVKSVVNNECDNYLVSEIIPVGKLDVEKVVQVYHQDYVARLTEALCESFEAIWCVLGDEDFFDLCKKYIYKYPSSYRELGEIGKYMPQYLETSNYFEDYPFIVDLAKFEMAFWKTFHSASEAQDLDDKALQAENILNQKFIFSANFKIFNWNYQIYDLWKLRSTGLEDCEVDFSLDQSLALFKTGRMVEALKLSPMQYSLTLELLQQRTLAEALQSCPISQDELQELFSHLREYKILAV